MPTIDKSNFNIACATLGGFITTFGLVSYLFKERLFLSEALISLLAGVTFSPHATGLIQPLEYANGSLRSLDQVTHAFTRLVLGVQLVLAGVQLPSKYLWHQWRPLALLLGPGMTGMWICGSLLIWGFIPGLSYVQALVVAACVTPTDPVLSNSIVKGKFADRNVPRELQRIIIAESGANDGLGYPFLFLALYLIKYVGSGTITAVTPGGAGAALGLWFSEAWAYEILLGTAYGATVGWVAKELLHWAEEHRYVDRESFLVFAITLALFIVGTCGMIGSDDVLACFIAGNVFTLDDWFRLETLDDSLQPTIDMLLNLAVFMWFGAVCPWASFADGRVVPVARLIPLGVAILALRRLPTVLALQRGIPQIADWRLAFFTGFFGPIGVSAVFYLFVALDFLDTCTDPATGLLRADAAHLQDLLRVIVWYLAICSIVVHGLSVPLGKLGARLPRTISDAIESRNSHSRSASTTSLARGGPDGVPAFRLGAPVREIPLGPPPARPRARLPRLEHGRSPRPEPPRPVFRIGGSVIPPLQPPPLPLATSPDMQHSPAESASSPDGSPSLHSHESHPKSLPGAMPDRPPSRSREGTNGDVAEVTGRAEPGQAAAMAVVHAAASPPIGQRDPSPMPVPAGLVRRVPAGEGA